MENEDNWTPCESAEKNGHDKIARYLESKIVFSVSNSFLAIIIVNVRKGICAVLSFQHEMGVQSILQHTHIHTHTHGSTRVSQIA